MTNASAPPSGEEQMNVPQVTEIPLASEFDEPSYEQWAAEVAKVLNRGRPPERQISPEAAVGRLRVSTIDGLEIEPIYTREDAIADPGYPGVAPYTRGTTIKTGKIDAWDVRALHEDPDVAFTKEAIKVDLERGVTSLWLRVDPDAIMPDDLGALLQGVYLNMAKVEVSSRTNQQAAAAALLSVIEASDVDKSEVSFNLGLDPIGLAALNGNPTDLSSMAVWVQKIANYKKARAFVVDGTVYDNAGAGDVHQTAWAIATATEYVRALIEQGLSADEAFNAINFRVSANTDQFLTIARLRALRVMWNRVGEVFEVAPDNRGARQHAVSSWREISRDDASVNMLRGTIATFSAAVGGAEAITTLPFDTAHGLPKELGRRIARNTGIILAEESNIGRVNDPAGGNWYVESLTNQIAEKAWAVFQQVEAAGGMAKALADGLIAADLAELNAARAKKLADRSLPKTGVSMFPQLEEPAVDVRPRPTAPEHSGLKWARDTEVFEKLRDAVAKVSPTPAVFLACLGTRRDFGGREGFSAPLFHIAGLQTPSSEGGSAEEIATQFAETGSKVAVLCSTRAIYEEQAIPVAKALKGAGAERVLLAGNLRELGDQDFTGLIDGNIALGMDVVEILNTTLDTLGVAR